MLFFNRRKILSILAVCLLGFVYALPNLLPAKSLDFLPSWWPKQVLSLGLDLQGGSHLMLEADLDELKRDWLTSLQSDARDRIRKAKLGPVRFGRVGDEIRITLEKPEQADAILSELRGMVQSIGGSVLTGQSASNLDIKRAADGGIAFSPTPQAINERITNGLSAAMETIRRRVDALGTTEPSITRQGQSRLVVQVPGFDDPQRLKEIIGSTAKLSFHEVDTTKTAIDAETTGVPPDSDIVPMGKEEGGGKILIKRAAVVDGDDLVDAQPGFDTQNGEPIVSFRFNTTGARKFGKYTQENVGRPFAIKLDKVVISAPVIRDAILQGSGQISGSFTVEGANDLAIKLRSGALPMSLTVVEERSVGASLGQDSVNAGLLAGTLGACATIILTMIVYGLFGVFAAAALIVNGLIIVGIMSGMQSTLTLPGIAGIVLTIGMAVDSNVLIYERIREELRAGKTAINAIEAGFNRAIITIADSQLTTLAAALVMFWLGSGPIRGFAVTLSIGVITSVFTAITVVRLIIALWLRRVRTRQRQIEVPI